MTISGLSFDDRGFLGWYKQQNPEGKILAIDIHQLSYLGDEDFWVQGDLQSLVPQIMSLGGSHLQEKILKCWFDVYNERDWDAMQSIYSEDALVHGKEGDLRGGSSVVELAKKWLVAIPDACITPLYVSQENDVIVARWRLEGTFENSIRDIPLLIEHLILSKHSI